MNFDEFVQAAREMIAKYVNVSLPELTETLLARELCPGDVEPESVVRSCGTWAMRADTALPDGRIYRVEYSCRTDAWMITAYRREAPKNDYIYPDLLPDCGGVGGRR